MHAGSPLGMVEEDPQTKQAVLNTIAKGGRSLRTPMPSAAAAANTTTIATVLNKKAGEHPRLYCTSFQVTSAAVAPGLHPVSSDSRSSSLLNLS